MDVTTTTDDTVATTSQSSAFLNHPTGVAKYNGISAAGATVASVEAYPPAGEPGVPTRQAPATSPGDLANARPAQPSLNGNGLIDGAEKIAIARDHLIFKSDSGINTSHSCHRCIRRSNEEVIVTHSEASVIVSWDGISDKECPRNWSFGRKSLITFSTSLLVFIVSFGSSIFAPAGPALVSEFGTSFTVSRLSVSLWILGFNVISGPISDIWGNQIALAISMLGLCLFQLPAALATNIQTTLISRFVSGIFSSGISIITPRIYTDLYSPLSRSIALTISITALHLGTTTAPITAAYLLDSALSSSPPWRWLSWLTLLLAAPLSLLAIPLAIPETSTPLLLRRKARHLRLRTGNWALHAQSEESPTMQPRLLIQTYFSKPLRMFTDPLLLFFTLYTGLVYGVMYLVLYAIPLSFQTRGWDTPTSHLPLLAVALGGAVAGGTATVLFLGVFTFWRRGFGAEPAPERRILPAMVAGSVVLPVGMVWFGWTGDTHWMVQIVGIVFVGGGSVLVLVAGMVYLLEVYGVHAESAMVGHLAVRNAVAASFPVWVGPVYEAVGVGWASSAVAAGCLVMVPVLLGFVLYGKRIREGGRYGLSLE